MRVLTLVLVSLALIPATASAEPPSQKREQYRSAQCVNAREGLRWYVRWTNHWRVEMGASGSQPFRRVQAACPRYLAKVWRSKARAARHIYKEYRRERLAYFRELYEKWRCIHEHEGAWNSNTGNGYYGGLQMDTSFQAAYGPEFIRRWGYAHNWPVWAQLVAAERAYASRGFNPWPNTARMCGVL